MKGKEVAFFLEDGVRNTIEQWGSSGPVLLCVHGMTSSRRGWERLAGQLSSTYRVFAIDQRGHGDLAGVWGPMTLDQSVRDLEAAVRTIGETVDILLGHSWGGAVALMAGPRIAARSVVAIDPVIRVLPGTFGPDYVADLRELLAMEGEGRKAGIRAMYADLDPLDREAKVHALSGMSIRAIERIGEENDVESGKWDLRPLLSGYSIPLLILVSGEDSVIAPGDREWLGLQEPRVTVRTVAGAGHNIHRSHLDRVVEEIRVFGKTVFGR